MSQPQHGPPRVPLGRPWPVQLVFVMPPIRFSAQAQSSYSKLKQACGDIEDDVAIKGVQDKERVSVAKRLDEQLKAEIASYNEARPKKDQLDVVSLAMETG